MYINICEIDRQSRFDAGPGPGLRQGAQGWCTGMTLRDGMGERLEGGLDRGHMYTPG